MLLRLFTDTVLPARSAGLWMSESAGTTTAPKSFSALPEVVVPLVTYCRSRPCPWATMTERVLPKAKSKSPLTTPGTAAAPPLVVWISRLSPSSSKKPCSLPSQIAAVSTMGMTPTVTSCISPPAAPSVLPASPPCSPPPHAASTRTDPAAPIAMSGRRIMSPLSRCVAETTAGRHLCATGNARL